MKNSMLNRMFFVAAMATTIVSCREESFAPKDSVKAADVVVSGARQAVTAKECTGPRLELLPPGAIFAQGQFLSFNILFFNSGPGTAALDEPGNAIFWNAFLSTDGVSSGPNLHFTAGSFINPIAPPSIASSFGSFLITPGEDLSIYKFLVIRANIPETVGNCSGNTVNRSIPITIIVPQATQAD